MEAFTPDAYVEWFLPRAAEMYRVLTADGSFVLNIKERTHNGERHTYVMELVFELRKQGWRWTEEYIWVKTNTMPGKWPDRFKDGWERLHHFTKQRKFKMNQDAVREPMKESTLKRIEQGLENGVFLQGRRISSTNSGADIDRRRLVGKDTTLPSNVLTGPKVAEARVRGHSAAFPEWLPEFFIKAFTNEHDLVLDPFVGSGTTCRAAERLNRNAIGIDLIDPTTLTTGD